MIGTTYLAAKTPGFLIYGIIVAIVGIAIFAFTTTWQSKALGLGVAVLAIFGMLARIGFFREGRAERRGKIEILRDITKIMR